MKTRIWPNSRSRTISWAISSTMRRWKRSWWLIRATSLAYSGTWLARRGQIPDASWCLSIRLILSATALISVPLQSSLQLPSWQSMPLFWRTRQSKPRVSRLKRFFSRISLSGHWISTSRTCTSCGSITDRPLSASSSSQVVQSWLSSGRCTFQVWSTTQGGTTSGDSRWPSSRTEMTSQSSRTMKFKTWTESSRI